ncbi:hypothetical protein [Thermomicrobium roseum]|uniref:hypothetical protein n=1 Tax=Thermomicrobium roseum TaxID=500 RepID=UPI00059CACA6|nr:hypothetical protein [Thermomicrobium roseum]
MMSQLFPNEDAFIVLPVESHPRSRLPRRPEYCYPHYLAWLKGGIVSAIVLSPKIQELLIELLRELGRPATTEELVRLLRERLQSS